MRQEQLRATYSDYAELWNYNLQKIEQIGQSVKQSIHDLEGNYAGFETQYAAIMHQLDILSSIYAGYNTIAGAEEVMRLKAVLRKYAAAYTREGLDFNLVHHLLAKIEDARNASFEDFPSLTHRQSMRPVQRRGRENISFRESSHRWISFRRNHSWFIARFASLRIYLNDNYQIISVEEPDCLNIDIHGTIYKMKDLFMKSLENPLSPCYYLLLDRGQRNYAADEIGKRIYAGHDFINPRIRPFRSVRAHSLSPGRVRLFGKNHIVLY